MPKRARFVLLALASLCSIPQAWAGYDARGAELKDTLSKKELRDPQEREILQRAVDDYIRARNECLDDLVRIVEESSTSRTEQERAWVDRVAAAQGEVQRFRDVVKSIPGDPSVAALSFAAMTAIEEDRFLSRLGALKVGEKRDLIIANQKNVAEMSEVLDEKWRSLFDQDNAIDDSEKQVVDEIGVLIDGAFDEADRDRRTIREKLVAGVDGVTKITKVFGKPAAVLLSTLTGADLHALEEAIRAIKEAEPAINSFAKLYLKTNAAYVERANTYANLLRSERGGIYVLYGGFRQSTQEFVDKNGFDQAKREYQAASDALSGWVSGGETSGQKSDADAFSREALAKLSNHLSLTERTFNDFVSRHRGKFFGPISSDIREALAETRVWEDRRRMIAGKDLESKLRSWRDEANTFFTVSLSGLSSEDQEYLRNLIRPRVEELVRSLDDAEKIPARFQRDFDRRDAEDDLK